MSDEYPTVHAYEAACAALHLQRARAERAEREIGVLKGQLRDAESEIKAWAESQKTWKQHAERMEREVIESNEFRAFVRYILMLATEALEEADQVRDGSVATQQEAIYEAALVGIRDHILPTEEERATQATLVELPETVDES